MANSDFHLAWCDLIFGGGGVKVGGEGVGARGNQAKGEGATNIRNHVTNSWQGHGALVAGRTPRCAGWKHRRRNFLNCAKHIESIR